jgi:superfamily II DNA or RNA helicase
MPAPTLALRPYQRDAADAVFAAWQAGMRRPGLSMATGAGKTIVFSKIIEESNERALVIAHRKELIEQAAQKIGFVIDPHDVGIVMADRNQASYPVVVASIQTIVNPRRLAALGQFGVVVIDEAHHSASPTYVKTLAALGVGRGLDTKALGVTATWDRADGLGLEQVFDQIVYTVDIESLIASGHLCDIAALTIETHLDMAGVSSNGRGDYDMGEVERRIVASDYADTLAHAVREHASDRTALAFAPNVRSAEVYRDALRDVGIRAEMVSAKTPRHDRERVVRDFGAGRIQAVVNVGVFTEGTDIPRVDCVVMGRPTKSRALYQQMAGRGLRPFPGKENCIVLDLVGITGELKLQTAASLIGREPKPGTTRIDSFRDWLAHPETYDAPGFATIAVKGPLGQTFRQRAKPIDLIDRTRLAWVQVDLNAFSLPAGEQGSVLIDGQADGTYRVVQFGRDNSRSELARGLDIGYAQGIAESFVVEAAAKSLANPNAGWRKPGVPATDKQLAALERMRVRHAPGISKGEASELISRAIDARNLRRLRKEDQHVPHAS